MWRARERPHVIQNAALEITHLSNGVGDPNPPGCDTGNTGCPNHDHTFTLIQPVRTVVKNDDNPRVRALLDQLEQGRGRPQGFGVDAGECLVTDARFGAKCDNATNDTLALQKALDTCGSVALPDGRTCLTHGLQLRNGSQFRIPGSAVLKAFPNASAWDEKKLFLLAVADLRDATLYGGGTLDGSGNTWWVTPNGPRPHIFFTGNFHNTTFRDLKLINSGRGMLPLGAPCSDIMVDSVSLTEPAIGNSDGIDVSCDGFVIQNSLVQNGDDSICMKSQNHGSTVGSAKNGLIRNCTVRQGVQLLPATQNYPGVAGGLVLGTAVAPAMENITYTNCSVYGALAGIRIKFRPTQFGFVRNILFEDIRIFEPRVYAIDVIMSSDHVDTRLGALSQYEEGQGQYLRAGLGTVDLQNVTIRNVQGQLGPVHSCGNGPRWVCPRGVARFSGSAQFPVGGMRLEHINIRGFNASRVPLQMSRAAASMSSRRGARRLHRSRRRTMIRTTVLC